MMDKLVMIIFTGGLSLLILAVITLAWRADTKQKRFKASLRKGDIVEFNYNTERIVGKIIELHEYRCLVRATKNGHRYLIRYANMQRI